MNIEKYWIIAILLMITLVSLVVVLDKKSKLRKFIIVFLSINVSLCFLFYAIVITKEHFSKKKSEAALIEYNENKREVEAKNKEAITQIEWDWDWKWRLTGGLESTSIGGRNPLIVVGRVKNNSKTHLNNISFKYKGSDCGLKFRTCKTVFECGSALQKCTIIYEDIVIVHINIPPGQARDVSFPLIPESDIEIKDVSKVNINIQAVNSLEN